MKIIRNGPNKDVDIREHQIMYQSNSSMHHYECVALYKDINLQRGRF